MDRDIDMDRGRSQSRTPVPEARDRTPVGHGWDTDDQPAVPQAERARSPPPASYDRSDRDRSSPPRFERRDRDRSPPPARRTPPPPVKSKYAPRPGEAEPTKVLGVFGLSIRTVEADLQDEFDRIAPVEKVVVVYDARTSRSRGFGFVTMESIDGAKAAIEALNGKDLHGRRIRVDFSVTHKPHQPTPGIYKGDPRPDDRYSSRGPPRGFGGPPPPRGGGYGDRYSGGGSRGDYDRPPPSYRDREPYGGGRDREPYGGGRDRKPYGGDRRDYRGPDSRDDWRRRSPPPRRDRRSPSPVRRGGGSRYSRSPSPRRGGDRYGGRDDRVPPPSRSRQGSHLDSPPRGGNVEPSRYY